MKPRALVAPILTVLVIYPLSTGPVALFDHNYGTHLWYSGLYRPLQWVCKMTHTEMDLFYYVQFWVGD
jgi:hypothetical protein